MKTKHKPKKKARHVEKYLDEEKKDKKYLKQGVDVSDIKEHAGENWPSN